MLSVSALQKRPGMARQLYRDQRLKPEAESSRIDLSMEASQAAFRHQTLHAS